jgi:hypothetical protein
MRIVSGGNVSIEAEGGVCLVNRGGTATGNLAYEIRATTGGVKIASGGQITEGSLAAQANPQDGSSDTLPHLLLDSPAQGGNTHLTANKDIVIAAGNQVSITRANSIDLTPKTLMRVLTDRHSVQAKTEDRTILGQSIQIFSGPKNFLPTNRPLRSVTFAGTPITGHIGGKTDEYKMVLGDRDETFLKGNHTTSILIGDLTYQTGFGTVLHRAGVNEIRLSTAGGLKALVPLGTMSMTATSTATFRGVASVRVTSAGPAVISGSICTLGGVGKVGGIVSQSDIDPLSGLPLGFFGMGSPGHLLGPPIP